MKYTITIDGEFAATVVGESLALSVAKYLSRYHRKVRMVDEKDHLVYYCA